MGFTLGRMGRAATLGRRRVRRSFGAYSRAAAGVRQYLPCQGDRTIRRAHATADAKDSSGEEEPASEADGEEIELGGEENRIGPDTELAEALSELEPANFLDLARAFQEMGRDAEALEVLALIVEAKQGENAEEVADALRRMRRKFEPHDPGA